MKRNLPFLLLLAASSTGADDFDQSSYLPSTLAEATAELGIDPRTDYWFDASHSKYRVKAKFTGQTRRIDPNVKGFIVKWVRAMGHPTEYAQMFSFEVEIEQDGARYWMPIQNSLVDPWRQEMAGADAADLSLLLMGAYDRVPVFTISSFSAVRPN